MPSSGSGSASGIVSSGGGGSGTPPSPTYVASSPATAGFAAFPTGPTSGVFTFAIPAGNYTGMTLTRTVTITGSELDGGLGVAEALITYVNGVYQASPTVNSFIGGSSATGTVTEAIPSFTGADLGVFVSAPGTITVFYQPFMSPGSSESLTSLVLTLYPSGSSSGDAITFSCSAGPSDSNGALLVTVTLKDSNGDPTPAPSGGQAFLIAATSGTLSSSSLFLPQGSSSGNVSLQGSVSGAVTITIQASTGPCLGQSNCVCIGDTVVPALPVLDGGTPDLCLIMETRANWRDTLRRMLGITPDVDVFPNGTPGAQPYGEPWPTNPVLNQAIANAFQMIGRECHWHRNTALSVDVPAVTANGVQWIGLQGVGGSPFQNLINTVERCVFTDTTGQTYRLSATSFEAMQRERRLWDNDPPTSIPREFFITGYQIGLLPGASAGGTLQMYADTALIGFCSDSDIVDELPLDYHPVVQQIALYLVLQMHPNDPERQAQAQMLAPQLPVGLHSIQKWLVMRNGQQPFGFIPTTQRRRR